MPILIKKNSYFDSITLMRVSEEIRKISGIKKAQIVMGTPHNKSLLKDADLWSKEADGVGPNDLCIAFEGDDGHVELVLAKVDDCLHKNKGLKGSLIGQNPRTIAEAVARDPKLNMAIISVPGEYAAREARQALNNGLNVMMFSDNVTISDELDLKKLAIQRNLLMMGPDCGTAIINGVGLGFSNEVRRGNIGIVGASGTGIQEVSVLIDRLGLGISQAIGTGGRDLKKEVGALTARHAIELLRRDLQTEVIVIISKPPHPDVVADILCQIRLIEKPVVLCFIGLKEDLEIKSGNIFCTKNLTEAAMKVAAISKVSADIFSVLKLPDIFLSKKQNKIFGLFCGGTLCAEAENIIGGDHKFIDFGDDEYTKGKPHPMIDPQTRNQAFIKFADDPEAGVILFDIVLGYGSHPDPSGNISLVIEEISRKKKIIFIASVCGSEGDLQTYSKQVKKLQDVGVIVAPSNAIAAEMALLAIKSI